MTYVKRETTKSDGNCRSLPTAPSSIAYRSGEHDAQVITFPKNNRYTMQVLYRMGYQWPVTTPEYLERFIEALNGLGFFEILI